VSLLIDLKERLRESSRGALEVSDGQIGHEFINILAITVTNVLPSGGAGMAAPAQFNVSTLRFSSALVLFPRGFL
jgi:hypothetical protein